MNRLYDILNGIEEVIKSSCDPDDTPMECEKEKLEDKIELEMLKKKMQELKASDDESPEMEMMEYKQDFYEMSVGSIRAIMNHSANILKAIEANDPKVKNNLTESWLQGKIAITEDYMRTIHDFVMFVSSDDDDTSEAKTDRPGLWENIRKKREREGKNYKPAKPGDKDRPNPEQWKKLTKTKSQCCEKCGMASAECACLK